LISLSDRMYNLLILVVFVYFMSVIKDLIIWLKKDKEK
jgi:hypothetical protein